MFAVQRSTTPAIHEHGRIDGLPAELLVPEVGDHTDLDVGWEALSEPVANRP